MPSSSRQVCSQSEDRSVSPEISLSITTTPSKLLKVACQFQLDKNAAQAESLVLRRKLADVMNQEEDGSDDPNDGTTYQETLAMNAGHHFVILYSLWLQLGERTFRVECDPDIGEAKCFENGNNKVQGELRDIQKVLGNELSGEISSEAWIAKVFTKGMKVQRSNTATHLCHHCAAIFGVSDCDLLQADMRREKFQGRIRWVDNGQGSGSYLSVDVEILHKEYSGSYDIKTAFLNPILMRASNISGSNVFVAIIQGPTAAKELMSGIPSNPKTDTMARKHGIQHITPGAIAAAAVLSCWTLSSDVFLQSTGTNTGINYNSDFEEYLEILTTGIRKKKKSILNVFREWDQIIFPDSDSSLVGQDKGTSSGLKTAMEMLDADEVEEEDN